MFSSQEVWPATSLRAEPQVFKEGKLGTPNIDVMELMKLSISSCISSPTDSNEPPAGLLRLRPLQGSPSHSPDSDTTLPTSISEFVRT